MTLCDTSLLQLSEIEAAALQQVALEKLTDFNLGCTVRIPKGKSWQACELWMILPEHDQIFILLVLGVIFML